MWKLHKQKGQGLVEFGIILPLFVLLLMGVVYVSILCYDVITISTMARDSARRLSVVSSADMISTKKSIIENPVSEVTNIFYSWNPDKDALVDEYFAITPDEVNKSVKVVMTAKLARNDYAGLGIHILPEKISGEATMYWEKYTSDSKN